jgi:hypothetical protein
MSESTPTEPVPTEPPSNPDMGTPSAPAIGGAMIMGPLEVTFSWQAPLDDGGSPITTYEFTMIPVVGEQTTIVLPASQTYYEAKNLAESVPIQATVRASNDNGQTYGFMFVFQPVIPVVTPTNGPVSVTALAITPGTVEVTWEPPTTVPEGFAYYLAMSQSSNPADPSVGYGTQNLEENSCQLSELNPASSYTFSVVVINAAGRSPPTISNTVVFN